MVYKGKDLNDRYCKDFINNKCDIIKQENDLCIELYINLKENEEEVGKIICFFYNSKKPHDLSKKNNALHIKRLSVYDGFREQGIGTYLMKEIISYAEKKKFKHITVNPCAHTIVISQLDLEKFYKNFRFTTFLNKGKEIEFEIITD